MLLWVGLEAWLLVGGTPLWENPCLGSRQVDKGPLTTKPDMKLVVCKH